MYLYKLHRLIDNLFIKYIDEIYNQKYKYLLTKYIIESIKYTYFLTKIQIIIRN